MRIIIKAVIRITIFFLIINVLNLIYSSVVCLSTNSYGLPAEYTGNQLAPLIIATLILGLILTFGVKKAWWRTWRVRKENKMLNPSRPFSITGVNLEGFDPAKAYPVLAINMDLHRVEVIEEAADEGNSRDSQSEYRNTAFFQVGDEQGEFAWIAEVDCKLAPAASG